MNGNIELGQNLARQAMIQSLMSNQGMTYDQAAQYAEQQISAASQAGGPPSGMNTLNAQDNYAFKPPVTPPPLPQVEQTAPQVASKPGTAAPPPPSSPAVSSPSSPSPEASPSIFDNPEAVDAVLGMGGRNREMAYAEKLRNMAAPEGRYVSNGRVYVASNPLEHIARGVGSYKGNKMMKKLEAEQLGAKKAIIDALRNKTPISEDEDEEEVIS